MDTFWRTPRAWPKGNKAYIYYGEALRLAGKSRFGSAWTGREFNVLTRGHAYPSLIETLYDFRHSLDAWDRQSRNSFDATSGSTPRAQKSQYQQLSAEDILKWGERYRPQYDASLDWWNKSAEENAESLKRLEWVVDWMTSLAANGELSSYVRPVETFDTIGAYSPAPDGLWNTEDVIASRFYQGWIELSGLIFEGHVSSASDAAKAYIFFDRNELQERLRSIGGPPMMSEEFEGIYLSSYMRLALAVIQAEGITETKWGKVEDARKTARALAPQFNIDPEEKGTLIRYIGTIVRPPEAEAGRAAK